MFYDKFVELCANKQISPCAAAEEMGYQRSVVTRWGKGTTPRDATIQRVANYFGVSPSFLKGEEKKENPTATMDSEALKDNGYYELNEDNKKLIDQMIAQLIKSQSGD